VRKIEEREMEEMEIEEERKRRRCTVSLLTEREGTLTCATH
jgi:hypothetical protein